MIAFLFTTCLVAATLWFLWRVPTAINSRSPMSARQERAASAQPAPHDELDAAEASLWTALDDHQLTRLLKGSSS